MSDVPAPAGWYPDPTGRAALRWWDGSNWTDHADDATEAAAEQQRPIHPSGWYADPTGEAARRWWDGSNWTQETQADPRPPASPARRMPVGAIIAVVAVVLLAGGVATATLLSGNEASTNVQRDEVSATPDASSQDGSDSVERDTSVDPRASDDAPDAASEDDATDEPASDDTSDDERITVDFDDVCSVEMEREQAEAGDLRPWDVGCDSAPVPLARGESRWIVVVSSLNGMDFDQDSAISRSRDRGLSGEVLWSSHYPSLNPDLWVVFDGPFSDEQTANARAGARGDGSYARVLSDDDGDRYCKAADGCVGERENS